MVKIRNSSENIVMIIESSYDQLTHVEKSIADYFIKDVQNDDLSSKAVSQRLFVSESSLSRFSQKLGFSGYREFLFVYQQSLHVQKDLDRLTQQVLDSYQKILEKTYALISNEQMVRIAQMLDEYERVYVYGMGSSSFVASEFKLRFMRLGLNVDCLTDAHSIVMNMTRIDKKALVIGISISGKTEEVIRGLKDAKEKEAKTILLSTTQVPEYSQYYDEFVFIGGLKNLVFSNKISPQIPALIITDILYTHYLHLDKRHKEEKLKMTLNHLTMK